MRYAMAFVLSCLIAGCESEPELIDGVFTQDDWSVIETLSPLPEPPPNPTNRYADDPAAAALGQKLFFETAYTGAIVRGTLAEGQLGTCCTFEVYSCATCHDPANYFVQTNTNPSGLMLGVTGWFKRNAPTVMNNAVYLRWNFWDGRRDTIWANAPNCEGSGMRGSRTHIAHMLYEKYRAEYDAIVAGDPNSPPLPDALDPASPDAGRFPADAQPYRHIHASQDAWNNMTAADQDVVNRVVANWGKFLEAYIRKLVTPQAPFDAYVAGDKDAISPAAKRGLKLFVGKAVCVKCHSGPAFSDDKFHNTAVAQSGPIATLLPDAATPGFGQLDTGRKGAFLHPFGGPATHTWRSNGPYSDDPTFFDYTDVVEDPSNEGQFHTQGLRNVEHTAPYMHAGQLETLEQVVELYDRAGDSAGVLGVKDILILPLHLTPGDRADLVEFMKTLTTSQYPDAALLENTATPGATYSQMACVLDPFPQCSP